MNAWQLLLHLRSVLAALTWGVGDDESVFGRVLVTSGLTDDHLGELRMPLLLIGPGQATPDDSAANLVTQEVALTLIQQVESDQLGEAALLGGPQTGTGSSNGRGLLEVEEKLLDAVAKRDRTGGVTIRCDWASAVATVQDQELGALVVREYRLSAWVTADRFYPPVTALTASDDGSGGVDLAWTNPGDRFDRHEVVIRRAAGATAPATVTDGDAVASGSVISSYSDAGTAVGGTYSYSVFVGYDDDLDGDSDNYSVAATATVTLAFFSFVDLWWRADLGAVASPPSWTEQENGDSVLTQGSAAPDLEGASVGGQAAFFCGNNGLDNEGLRDVTADAELAAGPIYGWVVFQQESADQGPRDILWHGQTSLDADDWWVLRAEASRAVGLESSAGGVATALTTGAGAFTNGEPTIAYFEIPTSGSMTLDVNNGDGADSGTTRNAAPTFSRMVVGFDAADPSKDTATIRIAEIAIASSSGQPSAGQRASMLAYLNARYGTAH